MPKDPIGQQITFTAVQDPDVSYTQYVTISSQQGDTITLIAARRGQPQAVSQILALNKNVKIANGHFLRSATDVLKANTPIRLPGTLLPTETFDVTAGEERPIIKDGYAKYDIVDRRGRVGISRFTGYNPIKIDVAIQFENYTHNDGLDIEHRIEKLERMAGREPGGIADGPPSVIRVAVTDNQGNVVPLVPWNFQWSPYSPAPLYRITGIAWGSGALSDDWGRRTRQTAVVTVEEYTQLTVVTKSASQRAKSKAKPKK